ncbi:hypothetical protein D9M70_494990 [compost metagenome]
MAQALHFHLAGVGEAALVDQAADADQVFLLVGALDLVLQLVADIEMVFQGALATTCNDGDLVQARIQGLFNAVLDQRLVDHWQHFLGHRLGGRQKAGTVTSGGKQAFLDHFDPLGEVLWRIAAQSNHAAPALQCPLAGRPMPRWSPPSASCAGLWKLHPSKIMGTRIRP